jgi:cytochrome P450
MQVLAEEQPPRPTVRADPTPLAGNPAPGARGRDLARLIWELNQNALKAMVGHARAHGDVAELRIPGARLYTVYRPEHMEHVLITNQDNYVKGPHHEIYASGIGRGLITANGDLWRRQRALIQPMFAKRHLDVFTEHMTGAGADMLDRWETDHRAGQVIDFNDEMMALTIDVVGRALFGADLTGEVRDTISAWMHTYVTEAHGAITSPLTWAAYSLPGVTMEQALKLRPRKQRRHQAVLAKLDAIVSALIESHRHGRRTGRDDLLSLLLDARDESGRGMGDQQVRDEVVNFILAGHETTANNLSWMFQYLSLHPDIRARMYDEVDRLLGGSVPTFADAERLVFTRAVVQETLRICPVVWMAPRLAVNDDVIGGVRIPAGTSLALLIWLTHRTPEHWSNPEGFEPERFLPENSTGRHRCAFVPFTAGRRVCIGNTFALIEGTLLAAMIAQRYTLDLAVEPVEPEPTLTLRPRGGLPMRVKQRQPAEP